MKIGDIVIPIDYPTFLDRDFSGFGAGIIVDINSGGFCVQFEDYRPFWWYDFDTLIETGLNVRQPKVKK